MSNYLLACELGWHSLSISQHWRENGKSRTSLWLESRMCYEGIKSDFNNSIKGITLYSRKAYMEFFFEIRRHCLRSLFCVNLVFFHLKKMITRQYKVGHDDWNFKGWWMHMVSNFINAELCQAIFTVKRS